MNFRLGARLAIKPLVKPWSMERALHAALAAIVVAGWALVYTTLMRGVHPPDMARNDHAGTAVSTNVAPRQAPSLPATPATLRQ